VDESTFKIPSRLRLRLAARGSLVKRLSKSWHDHQLGKRKARHRRDRQGPATKLAAYLLGCQRSGTDMCFHLLDRCLDVDAFNEDVGAAFSKCRIKDAGVIRRIIDVSRARCVVFKPVCDSHRAIEVLSWHQPSRAVWLYRDYRSVANSSVAKWGNSNLRHLQHLMAGRGDWGWSQWNREGYPPEAFDEVRVCVDDGLTPHGAAAVYWYLRNRCYFSQALNQRRDVAIFRYRDLVTEPVERFTRLCHFLGLTFSEEMASTVHAGSLSKGRDIKLDPRIKKICDGMLARLDAEVERPGATESQA